MNIRNSINRIEQKLNIKNTEIIVAFSDNNEVLVTRDGSGAVNNRFTDLKHLKSFYKDRNAILLTISNFSGLSVEIKSQLSDNIQLTELSNESPKTYEEALKLVLDRASDPLNML